MAWEAWFTIVVVVLTLGALVSNRVSVDLVLCGSVALLVFVGAMTGTHILLPKEALAGLANEGLVTVAVLFVVVCGLVETGAVRWLGAKLLGRPRTSLGAAVRLVLPVTVLSAFMNNTPLVAMYIPAVQDWCRRMRISPSRLMLPLSYAAILGGTCTLIGTSTNIVVHGMWVTDGRDAIGLFEIAKIGLPCAAAGVVYLLFAGRFLIPQRKPVLTFGEDARSYTVEMLVEAGSPLVGQTIEQAGLRHLPGLFLAEIDRQGQVLAAVGPDERLASDDRLVFVGVLDSVVDLQKIRGLKPATNQVVKLNAPRPQRTLIEAVVSNTCPLIGRTVREGRFRGVYDAVVIAVARNGERVKKKIGDIVLRTGDTLLLEAPVSFVEQHRNSRDFYLVSAVENARPVRHERTWLALGILAGMIAIATAQPYGFGMLHAAVLCAGLMILSRCCTTSQARRAVDWQLVVVIAASLALGRALEISGAAGGIGHGLVGLAGGSPWLALAMVYLATMLLTETVTNNAAAVIMFPIAKAVAVDLGEDGVSLMPFVMTIMMAASASFSTPIGYQTNLMVMAPGGYRFSDYFRVGVPLNLLMMVVTVSLVPLIWPFAIAG